MTNRTAATAANQAMRRRAIAHAAHSSFMNKFWSLAAKIAGPDSTMHDIARIAGTLQAAYYLGLKARQTERSREAIAYFERKKTDDAD